MDVDTKEQEVTVINKVIKKAVSLILAISLLFSLVSFNIVAIGSDIVISDCSSTADWSVTGGNGITVDTRGYNSESAIHCQINYGKFSGKKLSFGPLNAMKYKSVEWDTMFYSQNIRGEGTMWEQIKAAYGTNGSNPNQLFLRIYSSNGAYRVYYLTAMWAEVSSQNTNWVHFSVDLNNYNTQNGNFDKSSISDYYFTTCDGKYSDTVNDGFVRLDNIMLTGYTPDEEDDIILSECEDGTGWSYSGNTGVDISDFGKTNKALMVNTSYGVLRPLSLACEQNVSGYKALEFDMTALNSESATNQFAHIMKSYTEYLAIKVFDGVNTAVYSLEDLQISSRGLPWYHIALRLNGIENIRSIELYTLNSDLSVPDTTVADTIYKFDNFIITSNDISENGYDYAKLTDKLLDDASSFDIWNYSGSTDNLSVSVHGKDGNAIQISADNGNLKRVTMSLENEVNISRHNRLSWEMSFTKGGENDDVWATLSEKYAEHIEAVAFDSSGNEHSYKLSRINVEAVSDGWYKFSVDLTEADKLNLKRFKGFSFCLSNGEYEASDLGYSVNIRLDNVFALYEQLLLLLGDANDDGVIDIRDLLRIKKYLADKNVAISTEAADITVDARIDSTDITALVKYLLGIIKDFSAVRAEYQVLSSKNYSILVKP